MPNRPLGNIAKQNPLVTAAPDTLVSEAAELMRDAEASALVVIDEDAIVGIVTERDIVFRVVADELEPDQTLVGGVMTANPIVLDSSAPLKLALPCNA